MKEEVKLNRQQLRRITKATKRNLVRQYIQANKIYNAETLLWVEKPEKVIWHKKINNLPRLYPNMSKAKVTVKETVN